MKAKALVVSVLTSLAACSDSRPTPSDPLPQPAAIQAKPRTDPVESHGSSDPHAAVPEIYKKLFEGGIPVHEINPFVEKLPYESISLERKGCFGPCPIYRVTFHKSGKAELHAEADLPQTGDFVGDIHLFNYGKLCYALDRLRFKDFKERYAGDWTDGPTFIVTATTIHGSKRVSDYGPSGPIELWMVQELIDSRRHDIDWKPKP